MTSEDIARQPAVVFSDLARTIGGLRVVFRNGQSVVSQPDGELTGGHSCVLYMIDGLAYTDQPPGTIDNYVQLPDIIGIEVYHPAAAPQNILQDAIPAEFNNVDPLTTSTARAATKLDASERERQAHERDGTDSVHGRGDLDAGDVAWQLARSTGKKERAATVVVAARCATPTRASGQGRLPLQAA